uniref:Kazal-like domain-containing protein n=1 Tax=Globisporangium ultimum (strain ATCC 200006 / CBS 805.95 / DAOM BR144) TaxID=431595 RepID=K3W6C0_GLOUD
MPGRCNDTTETCIIQGVECKQAPCLPIAICESKTEGSADIVVEHVTANCSRLCPMIDSPVCGSDGVSYANACYFDEAQCNNPGLSIAVHALCPEDRTFNLQYNSPLAAQDSSSGSSSAACDAIVCADIDDPVCTTSGTMKNACFLKREQCKHPYVELLRRGSCEPVPIMPRCPASCGQEYAPVCASSGVIYGNECLFRQAKCARAFASNFVARDLSYCELNVGDSSGTAQGIRTVITSVFD